MRAADFLAAAESLPFGSLDDLARGGGLVVVAPHPDDESLGCGGLIAEACARSTPLRLVVLSDGVGSHPNSAAYSPERLRGLREAETLAAAAALGLRPSDVSFLRLPDRLVPSTGPEAETAVVAIAAAARACGAGAILVTSRHDPHCDHEAAHALAMRAARHLPAIRIFAYPVWAWTLPPDRELGEVPRGLRIAVGRHRDAKARAIAAHRSQTTGLIADDLGGFRLDPGMVARLVAAPEIYLLQTAQGDTA